MKRGNNTGVKNGKGFLTRDFGGLLSRRAVKMTPLLAT
jgi:hypothetical protein